MPPECLGQTQFCSFTSEHWIVNQTSSILLKCRLLALIQDIFERFYLRTAAMSINSPQPSGFWDSGPTAGQSAVSGAGLVRPEEADLKS